MKFQHNTLLSIAKAIVLVLLLICVQVTYAGPEVNYPALRLTTKGEGMFYVGASELAFVLNVSGAEVEGVLSSGAVKITNGGTPVARMIASGGAGFYFYGTEVDTAYADKNVYFLAWEAGLDMAGAAGVGPASSIGGTYRHRVHIEENNMPVTGCVVDPEKDFWVWHLYVADDEDIGTNDYEMVLSGIGNGGNQAVLDIRLVGYTDTGVPLEHHVNIAINGNPVGDIYWSGKTEKNDSISFDPAVLVDGTNIITVAGVLDTGASESMFYLDDIDITYDRNFMAVSDQLHISGSTNAVVTVTDLTVSNVFVADLTSQFMPVLLAGVTIEPSNSMYAVSFAPSSPAVPYVVFGESSGLLVDGIAAVSAVNLKSADITSEYVIITVPDLESAAQRLADYRQGQRLDSRVVLLQDIYDQFNYGIESPAAIRQFVGYAYSNWVYSLRYVLLAGSGTYDYKGATAAADQLVPPMLVTVADGLTASDTWYADVNGDWIPEVAIGRLPAVTAEGMTNLVDRIIAHEAASGNVWRQTIIMCADNPDSGGNFHVSSEDVSGLVPGEYSQEKILMTSGGAAAASAQLKNAFNNGALFMNYFGHSGIPDLTQEDIFNTSDVAGLTNTNRLPVVTSMSCSMGRFEIPEYDCLGEALVLGQPGGAIAVFSPTSTARNRDSVLLCKEFYKKIFSDGEYILGDAVKGAMTSFGNRKINVELLKFYNLLGDPALYLAEVGAPTDDPFSPVIPEVVTWKTNYYTSEQLDDPAVSGDFSDSDEDGLAAIAEYAFGRNPTVADNSSLVSVKKSEVVLTVDYDVVLTFHRRKGMKGVAINIDVTSDFSSWRKNDLDIVHTQVFDDDDGVTETVKHYLRAPVDVDRLFITMSVEKTK